MSAMGHVPTAPNAAPVATGWPGPGAGSPLPAGAAATAGPEAPAGAGPRSLQDMEFEAIRLAVEQAGGNISEASKRLGISRNTIYRKLRWQAPKANG